MINESRRILPFWFALMAFFLPVWRAAVAQESIPDYAIKAWRIEEGLPVNSIKTIHQDRDGYLWLGTEAGLIRFNGLHFRIWNQWNTPGWKSSHILSIRQDSKGIFWIGSGGDGLYRWQQGKWSFFRSAAGPPGSTITALAGDRSGALWIGSDRGLSRIQGETLTLVRPLSQVGQPRHLYIDSRQQLWIAAEPGVSVIRSLSPEKSLTIEPVSTDPAVIVSEDGNGGIWAGGDGLRRIEPQSPPLPEWAAAVADRQVSALATGKKGRLWIGTYGDGLFLACSGKIRHYDTQTGLSDDFITSLIEDPAGTLWIGTEAGGLIRMKPRQARTESTFPGLSGMGTGPVLSDARGTLWIGTMQNGLYAFQGQRSAGHWTAKAGLPHDTVLSLGESGGTIWIGTAAGLCRIRNFQVERIPIPGFSPQPAIATILPQEPGRLWLGTREGLLEMEVDAGKPPARHFPDKRIQALLRDATGLIWVGTREGLFQQAKGGFRPVSLPDSWGSPDILALYESPQYQGTMYIGTNGNGVWIQSAGGKRRLTIEQGLPGNTILGFCEAPPGQTGLAANLWIASSRGIFYIPIDALQSGASEGSPIPITRFSEADGLPSQPGTSGVTPVVFPDRKGRVFYSTGAGVAVIESISNPTPPPTVRVEEIRVDGVSREKLDPIKIPPGRHMIEFYFIALDLGSPDEVRYRYRLEGFETEWRNLASPQAPAALYFNLSPGTYRFQVIAAGRSGQWNQKGEVVTLRVAGRSLIWWLLGTLLIGSAGAIVGMRHKPKPISPPVESPRKKYQTSALTSDRAEEIKQKLTQSMDVERAYLDPSLTMKKLSDQMHIHPNYLSQLINEQYQRNFNDFINQYRIQEAIRRLADPNQQKKSLLDLAYEVGFYSKSVFNMAFKKFTGMTPSEYRKNRTPD